MSMVGCLLTRKVIQIDQTPTLGCLATRDGRAAGAAEVFAARREIVIEDAGNASEGMDLFR